MAFFSIDIECMISSSQKIVDVSAHLKNVSEKISEISSDSSLRIGEDNPIAQSLKIACANILDEAVKMNSFGSALEKIANAYQKTEKELLAEWDYVLAGWDNNDIFSGKDKRNLWEKFWDWIKKREPDVYDTTESEQEKAADLRMKKEIWVVLQNERYSRDNWETASIEERKHILQDYMNELIVIYGLKHVKSGIKWDKNSTYNEMSVTFGQYDRLTHRIHLNEKVLSNRIDMWDSYELINTVSHELRHAYQNEAVRNPTDYLVSKETVNAWKKNFRHYINPSKDYNGYRNQPIEKDARNFEISRDDTF